MSLETRALAYVSSLAVISQNNNNNITSYLFGGISSPSVETTIKTGRHSGVWLTVCPHKWDSPTTRYLTTLIC